MLEKRLKQLRLAKRLSLDGLVAKMGGIVTKQSLSKYEKGKSNPSVAVLNRIAEALDTKAVYLISEPTSEVRLIAYRKASRLPKKELHQVSSYVRTALEDRIRLETATGLHAEFRESRTLGPIVDSDLPVQSMELDCIADAEQVAQNLRDKWKLGCDEIANVTEILEDHHVHVIDIETKHNLDGISAVAYENENDVRAAAVASRVGISGERQRLNLAHELGHLVLKVHEGIDEEKAAFRFAGAFLAPAETIRQEIGTHRASVCQEELLLLKKRFGMSVAALLYRLRDLDIITESYYRGWCMAINRNGWRTREPNEMEPERSNWVRRTVLRGLSEELLTKSEAERFLGEKIEHFEPETLIQKRAFLALSIEDRRELLDKQSSKAKWKASDRTKIRDVGAGDFEE